MKNIKHVYIGLPPNFEDVVKWVEREFRTNPLSHEPGGFDIIIEYHDGIILGYDWVKYPSKYINIFWTGEMSIEEFENEIKYYSDSLLFKIKRKINRIFARKYDDLNFENVPFVEAWNSTSSNELPSKSLEKFEYTIFTDEQINYLRNEFINAKERAQFLIDFHKKQFELGNKQVTGTLEIIPHPDENKRRFKTTSDYKNADGSIRPRGTRMYRYLVKGTKEELGKFKNSQGNYYKVEDEGEHIGRPLIISQEYYREKRPLLFNRYNHVFIKPDELDDVWNVAIKDASKICDSLKEATEQIVADEIIKNFFPSYRQI